jgi:ferric-dicitrate binding protein FerR (iron transport regulator)
MNSMPQNKFQDFIDDQFFVDWVKNPNPESNKYWEEYISQHPSEKVYFDQAKYIMTNFLKEKNSPKDEDVRNVWSNIQARIKNPSRKIRDINAWLVAASIVLIIGIGTGILFQIIGKQGSMVNYSSLAINKAEGNEVKLILSDNSEKRIAANDPSIKYSQNGEILVDSVAVSDELTASGKSDGEAFNQLIVPKGKRSSLTLSDGTKLFLNSGSQVIYPVTFSKKIREIYIRGEVYLKVAYNANCPFIVKTDHLDVKVLGTEFNVKSYPDETSSSVVLVKGSIQAIMKSKKIMMKESELLTLDIFADKASLEKTNVLEYISWKDGWMYCTNERIESIAKKLSRYYDVNIQFNDSKVKDITLTGKLDLKDECSKVFDVIRFIAPTPIDYKIVDGSIILSAK